MTTAAVGRFVGVARTHDTLSDYTSDRAPVAAGFVRTLDSERRESPALARRAKTRARARQYVATHDEQIRNTQYSPEREPSGSGHQRLEPGPRNPAPRRVGEGTAWQGRSGNNYQEEGEPLDAAGNLVTDEEGLCMCGPCKKRRAESASSRDEALEADMLDEGKTLDSPKAVNEYNRRRFGRK